ncbi:MbnP family protein [Lacinutrix sp. Hel_I_90]|uniref:MbnP family protein n=1 Tax=Lacinutrix sp. Hel_I_90 TaxID=1249999 RepID=UPI0005C932D3|nr:MbnP family protein [Lacinutrix sp. Hel_I_90]
MKTLKFTFALLLCAIIFSCSSNDDDSIAEDLSGQKGQLILKFDNGIGDQDFIFGTNYSKSNNESYKVDNLKYIISNIRIKDSQGNLVMNPEQDNAFIIDEAEANNAGEILLTLNNIDAADYTEITFGIGIDQERFALGANGQGDFLELAESKGMLWSWAAGYKFIRIDGTFSNDSVTDEPLNIHMGSVGSSLDNYREVTLSFTNTVRIRQHTSPEVHIKSDISKVFDGITTINFADGYDQVHVDAVETPIVANNISRMFIVHHVHND